MVGVDTNALQALTQDVIPDAMIMGQHGMDEHGQHVEMGHMAVPRNAIPMVGAQGPRGYISMGGLVTVVKVRAGITNFGDPGWYVNPPGTEARRATPEELSRDRISSEIDRSVS
jgi:hypothetical protein